MRRGILEGGPKGRINEAAKEVYVEDEEEDRNRMGCF